MMLINSSKEGKKREERKKLTKTKLLFVVNFRQNT